MVATYVLLPVLMLFATLYYQANPADYWRIYYRARHEVGLAYGVWTRSAHWWSHIGDARSRLILGPMPVEERGDRQTLRSLGVTRVVSLLEDFERQPGWLYTPVADYNSRGDVHLLAVDHEPLWPAALLRHWVRMLEAALHKGDVVYVHCRAGRGRSASLVVAYLMHTERQSFEAAHATVQRWRPQVSLNVEQRRHLQQYGDWLALWRECGKTCNHT